MRRVHEGRVKSRDGETRQLDCLNDSSAPQSTFIDVKRDDEAPIARPDDHASLPSPPIAMTRLGGARCQDTRETLNVAAYKGSARTSEMAVS